MKGSWKKVSGGMLIVVTALGMIALSLHARPVGGKFKLPFDAKFEGMALPSGDYTLTVNRLSRNAPIVVFRGNQFVGMALPQEFRGYENQGEKPLLVCIRHDGNVAVRALRLPNVGTFYFFLPKELNVLVAQQPRLIETVSVEVSGD
jgi:hypothetical protein